MTRRLALLILLGAAAAIAGCPGTAPTKVDEDTVGSTPRATKTAGNKTPKPVSSGNASATPTGGKTATPGPQATGTKAPTGSGTPNPTGTAAGGTPNPQGTATTAAATPTPDPAPKFATVLIEATGFKPSNVRVQKNGSVTFTNRDAGAEHSVAPDGDSEFTGTGNLAKKAAGDMDGGGAFIKFVEVGEYQFKCGVHPTETGKVIVVAEQAE